MTERSVIHATFSIERVYEVPAARVFAAWADSDAKAHWFAGAAGEHELDFRVGGREVLRSRRTDGPPLIFASVYHDIVPDERIVYASTLHFGQTLSTVSVTTVELDPEGDGTRLLLAEQGTFLDGHEEPAWREQGTGEWLTALHTALVPERK